MGGPCCRKSLQTARTMAREQETTPFVVCALAMLIVGMLFVKSMPASDYRIPATAVVTFAALSISICASGPLVIDLPPPYMLNPTGLIPSWTHFFLFLCVIALGGEVLNNLL